MMRIRRTKQFPDLRVYAALGMMVLAYCILLGALWRLQVSKVSQFESRIEIQSLRRVRLPGIRGKIYDRTGLCLADNRPSYTIALFPEEIRCPGLSNTIDRAEAAINTVSGIIGEPPEVSRKSIERHINWYRPLPLVLWKDITPEQMARFAEHSHEISGVDIYTQATRFYPYSPYTSHLLGACGDVEPANPARDSGEERFNYNLDEMNGRSGMEKLFNPHLLGEAGAKLVEVDVGIYRHQDLAFRAPEHGGDLRLTLDMEIQLLAHQAIGTNRGAVVVLDPNNGDVLAMLSSPSYDANLFSPYLSSKDWNRIQNTPGNVLLNRAVMGQYPPGSIFKPLVALAISTVNPDSIYSIYDSPSTFRVGNRLVRTHGHGEVDLREAIKYSANVYFFKTVLENGWEPIITQAKAIGLGQKTGIEVDSEASGNIPDEQWRQENNLGGWVDGDTVNLAIGQGYVTVTPLQMAMMTATIANGGYLYRPRLVQAFREPGDEHYTDSPVRRVGKMEWSDDALNVVRSGMLDVIMASDGTGKKAAVEGLTFAGKTGTAEYGSGRNKKNHTWMIAFAPFDNPQYAIAFVIEDGVSGGTTVGPRLKILMDGLFEKMKREGTVFDRKFETGNLKLENLDPWAPVQKCPVQISSFTFPISSFTPGGVA